MARSSMADPVNPVSRNPRYRWRGQGIVRACCQGRHGWRCLVGTHSANIRWAVWKAIRPSWHKAKAAVW